MSETIELKQHVKTSTTKVHGIVAIVDDEPTFHRH